MISVYLLLDCLRISERLHICIFAHSSAELSSCQKCAARNATTNKTLALNASSNGGDASRVGKRCNFYLVDLSLARRETRRPH